jgi:hypothetical protein
MKMEQSVPRRRRIKFRRQGITQKKAYNYLKTCTTSYGVGLYYSLVADFLVIIDRLYALVVKSTAEIRNPRISGLGSEPECKYFNP